MTTFRILALFSGTAMALASYSIRLGAQSAPAASQPDAVSIHLSLQKSSYAVGEKPLAVMTIKNTGQKKVCFSTSSSLYRIHVSMKDGEPPKTEFHRHLLGDFRHGDGPDLEDGAVDCRPIAPGSSDHQSYDLSAFYDLSAPREYSIYIEIYDPYGPRDESGHWLRTNTAQFEVVPASQ